MKRLSLSVFVVLAVCLAIAPAALASTAAHHRGAVRARHVSAAALSYARLGTDPTYAISGHVLDFKGNAVAGAEVDWGWWDNGYQWGGSNYPAGTGVDGKFNFDALAGNPGSDDLTVSYPAGSGGLLQMDSWTLDFTANNDGTSFSYDLQPAQVGLNVANAPSSNIDVMAGNESVGFAESNVALTNGSGTASVLPMANFDDVVGSTYTALPYNDYSVCRSQVEWLGTSPVSVTAGAAANDTVALDWSSAQHAALSGPRCRHSGKPGTRVSIVLSGWPTGEAATLEGYDYNNATHPGSTATSAGADSTKVATLTVPSTAAIGPYEVETYRSDAAGADSLVDMWDIFQVCTFKSSASVTHSGHAIHLSGKVPGTGSVTIYSTIHKVTTAPGTLAAKGWHRVGSYTISSRKFVTGLLHPTRSTYYVAKYKGYAFQAFTSVVKVSVH